MHEASLALALAEELLGLLEREGGRKVLSFTVEVGELSGVDLEALRTACEALIRTHPALSRTRMELRTVPACWRCRNCGRTFKGDWWTLCPDCGAEERDLLSGEELLLREVELEV
ncbi:hydrogenase maturation nickel metallochaperone HypA [Thermosulfurimonas marina]|uniref:Hydrogenase maturation factor HypA n=1 Tax=Thermosulfurimonas marina TaxID=2047767 RepID=A0A6H1WSL2_9BACT|nr:hydrogenase maturation nickel metallochaperone HypA [Thermosulfurimonas marina]QJA06172.1 hydrogenase maturation nickel metallochaperone HypA [Thermosulfurimonas marina]